jgi:hypothetical protein
MKKQSIFLIMGALMLLLPVFVEADLGCEGYTGPEECPGCYIECGACYDAGEYDGGTWGGWSGYNDGADAGWEDGSYCYDYAPYGPIPDPELTCEGLVSMGLASECCGDYISGFETGWYQSWPDGYSSGYGDTYGDYYGMLCCGNGINDTAGDYTEECDLGAQNSNDCTIIPPATSCNYCDATFCTWETKTLDCDGYCKNKTYTNSYTISEEAQGDPDCSGGVCHFVQGQCGFAQPSLNQEGSHVADSSSFVAEKKSFLSKLLGFVGSFWKKDEVRQLDKTPEIKIGSCSEFFKQGSIELKDLSSSSTVVKGGGIISFKLKVKNTNDYPLADGFLYAKVYREKDDKSLGQIDYLIDDFFAAENVYLWPGEERELAFNWTVPINSIKGSYHIALFFSGSKHFNLAGESFVSHMPAAGLGFTIEGQDKGFWLDNDNIKINEYTINHSTFFPVLKEGDVSISMPLVSTLGGGRALVSLELHPFDITNEGFQLLSYRQGKDISLASPQQQLDFTLKDLKSGAYVAKISVLAGGRKSIADARFSISGNSARYIITGLTGFPLEKNGENTIFACLASSADAFTSGSGRAEVSLVEAATGKPIAAMEYIGDISTREVMIKKTFSPEAKKDVVLIASLFDAQGNLVDQVRTGYVLNRFAEKEGAVDLGRMAKIVSLVLLPIVALLLIFFMFKKLQIKKQKINSLSVLFFIITIGLSFVLLSGGVSAQQGQKLILSFPWTDVNFQCQGQDQACCRYWYDDWVGLGLTEGTDWWKIQANHKITVTFDYEIWRESNPFASLSRDPALPANLSNDDKLKDTSVPDGEFEETGGYIYSPPINWLEDTGMSGNGVYYSDPDFNTRRCSRYDDVNDGLCPAGGDGGFVGSKTAFNEWCNNAYNFPYNDDNFGLPTYTMWYGIEGNIPNNWYYDGAACIGTQINCDRTMTISVTGPLRCTLSNHNPNNNPPGNPDGCNTEATGTCSLKARIIDSECVPTGVGAASITVRQDFDCFAYFDRGTFVKTEKTVVPFWQNFAYNCQGNGQCWCQGWDLERMVVAQQCAGLYYPMQLTTDIDTSSLTATYYLNVVDSRAEVATYKVGSAAVENYMGKAEIPVISLPTEVQFTCQYSDMFPGPEGTPQVSDIQCGDSGVYVGGSSSCTNPGGNNQGTCTFKCNYPVGLEVGELFEVRAKLKNTTKVTNCVGNVEITDTVPNNPPTPTNPPGSLLWAEPIDCCFHPDATGAFHWTFTDPDGDTQAWYNIQIDRTGSSDFADLLIDFSANSGSQIYTPVGRPFAWNANYYWRLMVQDNRGASSAWTYPPSTTSPAGQPFNPGNPWPWPGFSYKVNGEDPELACGNTGCDSVSINVGDSITDILNATSFCPSGCNYSWDFGDGTTSLQANPDDHAYNTGGNYTLRLTASDSSNPTHFCEMELLVRVGSLQDTPPKWKEISPFSWLRNLWASVSSFF